MRHLRYILAGGAMTCMAACSSAMAGGFQRGTADTDILYEPGNFATRMGVTYVRPNRGFSSINGVSGDYGTYTGNYTVPSESVYFGGETFGCAGTYTVSFAASADYTGSPGGALPAGPTSGSRTLKTSFESDEFGATCRVSTSNDMGRFSFLGGLFVEDFSFTGSSLSAAPTGRVNGSVFPIFTPTINSVDTRSDYDVGYRIGASYEKPEIALRAQVLYRSEVIHDAPVGSASVASTGGSAFARDPATGQIFGVAGPAIPGGRSLAAATSSFNKVTSPQSLYINVQTGIAPGTLLLASFRWTDWSTNGDAISTILTAAGSGSSVSPYHWKDGYTASIGLGRAFTDKISGAVAIGYDSGVSTGAETTYTDLYTFSAGVSLKPDKWGEIRFGGLIGYWTAGDQSIADGAYFNGHVDDTIVLAGTASLKLSF